jgi:phosphorylcholine metabolism protein LicD
MRLYDALTTMAPNIQFVLMYGGLIGYYMNRELLPFDDDLDLVVIGENSIHELIDKDGWETDEFLFEVQPWCLKRGIIDTHISRLINRSIDARMICKQTGMFIDLTFLYNVPSTDTYQARDFNAYDGKHLLPLRIGKIHGRSIYIPQNVEQTLKKRYGSVLKFNKRKLVNGQWQYADTDSIVRL